MQAPIDNFYVHSPPRVILREPLGDREDPFCGEAAGPPTDSIHFELLAARRKAVKPGLLRYARNDGLDCIQLAAMGVSIFAAFFAGFVSFLSPCVLPLVPAYLSIVTGVSVPELTNGVSASQAGVVTLSRASQRVKVLKGIGLFVAGFTVVFVLLGTGASAAGHFLLKNRQWFERVAGVFVIVMGLLVMGLVQPKFLLRERRFQVSSSLGGWAAPVMGAAFAFGWTPCIGPILGVVLTLAAGSHSIADGVVLLLAYALGLAIPFAISGLALSELSSAFAWVKKHYRAINIVSGAVLVSFGLLLVTGQVARISAWMLALFDQLGLERLSRS